MCIQICRLVTLMKQISIQKQKFFCSSFSTTKVGVLLILGPVHMDAGTTGTSPVVKKYLSSHVTPGAWGEVKNAIARSLTMHISKELTFLRLFR